MLRFLHMEVERESGGEGGLVGRFRRWLGRRQRSSTAPIDTGSEARIPEALSLESLAVPSLEVLFDGFEVAAPPPRALREAPTVEPACGLCGKSGGHETLYDDLPRVDTRASRIVRCTSCDFVFLSPRQAELGDSWWNAMAYLRDCLIPRLKDVQQIGQDGRFDANRNWRLQRAFVAAFEALPERFERRVIDVGSSFGGLVHALAATGWRATGIEPSEHVAEFGRAMLGVDIRVGTFEAMRDIEPVPCVTMTEVLEHCFDPRAAIRAVRDALVSGGLFFMSVPNFDSPSRIELGREWPEFVSDHFSHFTGETLGKLLQSEGFEEVRLMTAAGFPLLDDPLPGRHVRHLHDGSQSKRLTWLSPERSGPGLYAWAFKS